MLSVIAAQNRNSPAQVVQKCARKKMQQKPNSRWRTLSLYQALSHALVCGEECEVLYFIPYSRRTCLLKLIFPCFIRFI